MKRSAILGSTGSIGTQHARRRRRAPRARSASSRWRPAATSTGSRSRCARFRPELVVGRATRTRPSARGARCPRGRASSHGRRRADRGGAARGRVDLVVCGLVGAAGRASRPTPRSTRARTSRSPTRRRWSSAGAFVMRARARRRGRRSCPSTASTTRSTSACAARTSARSGALWLTASGGPFRTCDREALARGHARAGAAAPDLGDGPEDHDRLGDAHEQGARGDRGPLALRRRGRPDPGRRPPAEHRALAGRVRRRLVQGAARRHRHAPSRSSTR